MNMQKTIQERNKTVDELEQKLRDSELEKQKAEELTGTLKIELQPLRGQVVSLKDRLQAVTKDLELVTSGKFEGGFRWKVFRLDVEIVIALRFCSTVWLQGKSEKNTINDLSASLTS